MGVKAEDVKTARILSEGSGYIVRILPSPKNGETRQGVRQVTEIQAGGNLCCISTKPNIMRTWICLIREDLI